MAMPSGYKPSPLGYGNHSHTVADEICKYHLHRGPRCRSCSQLKEDVADMLSQLGLPSDPDLAGGNIAQH
ncbi:hypothetical protein P8C59_008132 [Phyllachora maydis]|uniref:Uncharacterized protein n=1 Tax=Phyllachora maydis TaxID=1825666 RepID=A0AAD9ME99_9PEZI|nr:hypothetical protein P8C59_008132 [Phyllachora maydis]